MENGGHELEESLQQLGAKRVEAALLAALLESNAMATKQIVARTGLRQPEVSVGMRLLRERGWVEAEPMPRQGKGRPMHQYRLTAGPDAIRGHFEQEAHKAIAAYKQALDTLRQST